MGILPADYRPGGDKRIFNFYQSGEFEQPRGFNPKNLDDLGSRVRCLALWADCFTCLVAMEAEK